MSKKCLPISKLWRCSVFSSRRLSFHIEACAPNQISFCAWYERKMEFISRLDLLHQLAWFRVLYYFYWSMLVFWTKHIDHMGNSYIYFFIVLHNLFAYAMLTSHSLDCLRVSFIVSLEIMYFLVLHHCSSFSRWSWLFQILWIST